MTQTWKTVRIFISSTFRDMHAERDHLVKVVFPELEERCAKIKLHMIAIDLRWGVTEEDAEQGKALEICLDEIENSRPFFIGLLGERYGFIPHRVPEDVKFDYPWLQDYLNHSLTALEIIHGVLRNPDIANRSFFYFRDPAVISQIPENKRTDYIAESIEASRKLRTLKEDIRSSGRPVMEKYPCHWDDIKGHIVDLDIFGHHVLEDLWPAIKEEYPEDISEPEPIVIERQMHEAFAEERSRLHIGREEQAIFLNKYVQNEDRRLIVITGESGCGKSAFLAKWYKRYAIENPDSFVLSYFIGASPDSTNHHRLLRNICSELKNKFNLKEEIPQDDMKLSETMAILLSASLRNISKIVLVIDALDQLSPNDDSYGLGWLLDYIPEKVCLVVSSLDGDFLEILQMRNALIITIPPLNMDEQGNIVKELLKEWRRNLDEKQMNALLAHPGVRNPLYLRVALEEMRLFGKRKQLKERIESLADDVAGLFDQVLKRLEEDHGCDMLTETFALIGSSRFGLSEAEILELLKREGEDQFPRVLWARFNRSAKAYLVKRGELIGFFHRQLSDAVETRYLKNENRHSKLAAYFNKMPFERRLVEYPYQLQHAGEFQSLAMALSDLEFFDYAWNKGRKYEWMAYWESLKGSYDPPDCYQKVIDKRMNNVGRTVEIAISMNKVGKFLSGMSFFIPALSMLENSFAILEPVLGSEHPEVAALLYNIARAYDRQYGKSKADLVIQYYNNAYEIYMKLGKPIEAAEVKIESSNFRRRALKKIREAKKDCEDAKKTLESLKENNYSYKLLYAQCLNILGLIYSGLNDSELVNQCQNLFQQSINLKKEVGDLDGIGESENAMGLFLRNTANKDMTKLDEAIDHLEKALEIRNSLGNYRGAAQSCRNLGLCYSDRIAIIEDKAEKEQSYHLAKQSYLNGIKYWNARRGKLPIEELLEFKYRLGELEINQGNMDEGTTILEELQEERDRIGDWHNRARALDLLLRAYKGKNEFKLTALKIIEIYQNVLFDEKKIKQIFEEPVRLKNAKDFLKRVIIEVPEYEVVASKIFEDISNIFEDKRRISSQKNPEC